MKLFMILAVIAVSKGDKLRRSYIPNHAPSSGGPASILETPILGRIVVPNDDEGQQHVQYVQIGEHDNKYAVHEVHNVHDVHDVHDAAPERPQAAYEKNAKILQQDFERHGDSYSYAYETENGIYAEESGVATDGVAAHGGYSYTGDDGKQYTIRYTADGNGFRPQGDHLPTPPPIPKEILESLEQNAREEAAGIFNDGEYDGSYDPKMYETSGKAVQAVNYVHDPHLLRHSEIADNDEDTIVTHSASSLDASVQAPRQYLFYGTQDIAQNKADSPLQMAPVLEDRSSNVNLALKKKRASFNSKSGYKY